MHDDTPLFRELLEETVSKQRQADSLITAVYADHYERHDGPIMFCDARACRVAWAAVRKAA